jgi:hypothetical protein
VILSGPLISASAGLLAKSRLTCGRICGSRLESLKVYRERRARQMEEHSPGTDVIVRSRERRKTTERGTDVTTIEDVIARIGGPRVSRPLCLPGAPECGFTRRDCARAVVRSTMVTCA